jgi:hypothetical protein
MSSPIHRKHTGRAGIALAIGLALATVPAAAQAAPVDLGTTKPFVVLGGQAVTNTGPSVLNGELGVSPGTALTGFGLPAVVNGATHNSDAVALDAQSALTNAYNVAAGHAVLPANDLTGTNLGNRTLAAAAYRFTSSAQLTGRLTLDAKGNPDAQFVFLIASTLTTAPASSVRLINGASPCNVFWQVGSSATLDTTTVFKGNLMALTSISLNDAATVQGRLLARNGQVTLIDNVIDNSMCAASTPAQMPTPTGPTATTNPPPSSQSPIPTHQGTAIFRSSPATPGSPRKACTAGFRGTVRGKMIKRVVFRLDGKRIAARDRSPFEVLIHASAGRHTVTARITFLDATAPKTMKMRYRACASAVLKPRKGPSRFTG